MEEYSEEIFVAAEDVGKDYPLNQSTSHFLFDHLRKSIGLRTPPNGRANTFVALEKVSFKLHRGESLGIIGRNGSGKSTLLQMVAGVLSPSRGEVSTRGRIASILELGAGFHPDFTGRENTFMQLAMLGLTRTQAEKRIASITEFADIGEFFEKQTKTYSSGMLVRLAFSVIAHSDPDILIVDEALAVGDAQFVQKCLRFINEFRKNGILLFVSHNTAAVRTYCERAIWIDSGRIRMKGTSNRVTEAYIEAFFEEKNLSLEASEEIEPLNSIDANEFRESTVTLAARQTSKIDLRANYLNQTNLRNDLKITQFREFEPTEFGKGGAKILHCSLLHPDNKKQLTWTVGGEPVLLEVHVACLQDLKSPVVGFLIRNSVGLEIFGDNTYITHQIENHRSPKAGSTLIAKFTFYMPILPEGDYTMTVGVGDGDETDHVLHHWIHDAQSFRSTSSSTCTGLVGIPMQNISIETIAS